MSCREEGLLQHNNYVTFSRFCELSLINVIFIDVLSMMEARMASIGRTAQPGLIERQSVSRTTGGSNIVPLNALLGAQFIQKLLRNVSNPK